MKLTRFVSCALLLAGGVFLASGVIAGDEKDSSALSVADAKKLKSPIPYTKKSIGQGRNVYMRYCTGCHGADAKATVDVVADATDLTSPNLWKNGTTEGEIFRSIVQGQGASMPSFKSQIAQQEDIWHLINFIRSLWPDSLRPTLQEEPAAKGKSK